MSDKLTDFETEILKALRKHRDKNIAELFSMDMFYKNLNVEIPLNRFKEIIILLEDGKYIKKISLNFGEELGCYDIEPEGIRYLKSLEQN